MADREGGDGPADGHAGDGRKGRELEQCRLMHATQLGCRASAASAGCHQMGVPSECHLAFVVNTWLLITIYWYHMGLPELPVPVV